MNQAAAFPAAVKAAVKQEGEGGVNLVDYNPGGILPSEMLFFVALCKSQGVDLIVESGRKRGFSTEVLARSFPTTEIVSIERRPRTDLDKRFDSYDNVQLITGDAETELARISSRFHYRRAALLVDGPKDDAAFDLAFP